MRWAAIFVALVALGLGLFHLWEAEARRRILSADGDLPQIAARLHAQARPAFATYPADTAELRSPYGELARALLTLENFATSSLERLSEEVMVRSFALARLTPPDLSLGAGQIRASTVKKAMLAMGASAIADERTLALQLLDLCRNQAYAALVIRHILGDEAPELPLSRETVFRIAEVYNGQVSDRALEAVVSAAFYKELAYHLYLAETLR